MSSETYKKAQNWMYRNARPIDIARWKYHFENGSGEDVLIALHEYQNKDGSFGSALEPDCWNPNSSPIQTWVATEILRELGITDSSNRIIKVIISYLDSGKDFINGIWAGSVPTNNEYPHAQWWTFSEKSADGWGYNPTACLAGFVLRYADKSSNVYKKAENAAKSAIEYFFIEPCISDMHLGLCYIRLYEYCISAGINSIFDSESMKNRLIEMVNNSITKDVAKWSTNYVCKPSQFLNSPDSIFYEANKKAAQYEIQFIKESMNNDGTWNVNWAWSDYPEEWAISKNWWKANQIIINMNYLKGFNEL